MAVVPDLSGFVAQGVSARGSATDRKLSDANRVISGSPLGSTTPQYTGERVLDSTGYQLWTATDLTVNGWHPVTMVT